MSDEQTSAANYLDPYREAVAKHGAGFEATLWGTRRAQQLRFDVMADLAQFDDCTIVDAGCGDGDFAEHLAGKGIAYRSFIGIDAMDEMIERARTRGFDKASFLTADMVTDPEVFRKHNPDYVCFSGTLNTMDDATARGLISKAFEAAAQGVVFNFLSDRCHPRWGGRDLTPARRFPTVEWIDWAMSMSSRVSMTQAYLDGHDATILIEHNGSEDSA